MSHHVTADGTNVTWRASSQAGPAAQATLDEFHGLPERFSSVRSSPLRALARLTLAVVVGHPAARASGEAVLRLAVAEPSEQEAVGPDAAEKRALSAPQDVRG